MTDFTGQNLGNYRLVRLLGDGGFAEVYLGEHLSLGTQAAIKVLYTHVKGSEANNFLAEARTIARLDHPSIVRILDYDVQDGMPFFVMAYAPKGNLRMRYPRESRLPLPLVNSYVQQIAGALQYAHDRKIIHRDIKPENMLVGGRDEILLSDFGLALIEQNSRMQSTQAILGTALYMSPEQLQGQPRLASDQYALGVVVYEWLTGNCPFHGTFMELYSQHISVQPLPLRARLPNLPPGIEEVVLTALAKDPNQRFASIKAFANAFEQEMLDSLPNLSDAEHARIPRPSRSSPNTGGFLISSSTLNALNRPNFQTSPPVSDLSDSNGPLPRGVRQGESSPSADMKQGKLNYSLPPMITTPDPPVQNQPQIPFYRVEDIVANRPERRLGRRELMLGGSALLLLTGSGAAWFLLASRPGKPAILQGTLFYTYRGHTSSVLTLAWSPDGTRIASADSSVRVWNARDGHTDYIYKGHSGSVNATAWSPSNKRIASAGDDTTVQVWNASDGGVPYIYKNHSASVAAVAWSPDGTRIASGSSDNTVQIWNASDGSAPYLYRGHTYHVNTVAWSPDGRRVASGGGDNTAQVWNAVDGTARLTYKGHTSAIEALAWSPDGTRIASASDDTRVQVWNAADGTALYTYRGHSASVTTIAWSPDGKRIASGSLDRTVQIWDASGGGSPYIYKGHSAVVNAVTWSPDGAYIASASNDHTAQIWHSS